MGVIVNIFSFLILLQASKPIGEFYETLLKTKSIPGIIFGGITFIFLLIFYRNFNTPTSEVSEKFDLDHSDKQVSKIEFEDVISKCNEYIGNGKTENALEILEEQLGLRSERNKETYIELYQNLLMLKNRMSRVKLKSTHNLEDKESIQVEFNRINNGVIDLLNQIEKVEK